LSRRRSARALSQSVCRRPVAKRPSSHRLIQKYFDEISLDTGKYCFGVEDTLRGLELGAVETLIVWENLDVTRHILRDSHGAEIVVHTHAPPPTASNAKVEGPQSGIAALSEVDRAKFIDKETGLEMEQASEPQNLLEWLSEK
jgi:peptide chain release factor subunit 1